MAKRHIKYCFNHFRELLARTTRKGGCSVPISIPPLAKHSNYLLFCFSRPTMFIFSFCLDERLASRPSVKCIHTIAPKPTSVLHLLGSWILPCPNSASPASRQTKVLCVFPPCSIPIWTIWVILRAQWCHSIFIIQAVIVSYDFYSMCVMRLGNELGIAANDHLPILSHPEI